MQNTNPTGTQLWVLTSQDNDGVLLAVTVWTDKAAAVEAAYADFVELTKDDDCDDADDLLERREAFLVELDGAEGYTTNGDPFDESTVSWDLRTAVVQ